MVQKGKIRRVRKGRPPLDDGQKAAMRGRITETAQMLFREEGYSAVSMRRIACEVGCTPMTLYSYFDGKIEILRHVWAIVFDEAFSASSLASRKIREPRARLKAAAAAYVDYWVKHPEHYRMVFMTESVSQQDVGVFVEATPIAQQFQLFLEPLAQSLSLSTAHRSFKIKADCLICGMHGIAHCLITISAFPWSNASELVEGMVDGLTEC